MRSFFAIPSCAQSSDILASSSNCKGRLVVDRLTSSVRKSFSSLPERLVVFATQVNALLKEIAVSLASVSFVITRSRPSQIHKAPRAHFARSSDLLNQPFMVSFTELNFACILERF
jgi:hypothetical protein